MGFVIWGRYIEVEGAYSDGTSLSLVTQLEITLLKFDLSEELAGTLVKIRILGFHSRPVPRGETWGSIFLTISQGQSSLH